MCPNYLLFNIGKLFSGLDTMRRDCPPHLLLLPPPRAAPDAKTSLAYTTGPFSAPHGLARPSRTTEGLILYGAVGPAVTGPPLAHC